MVKVFLGGTCNESNWRDILITKLDKTKVDYFNPVVDDWTEECQKREMYEREHCDFCLYVITPLMTGVYSIAEVTDDSNKRPEKTLFCVLHEDNNKKFTGAQLKSLYQVCNLVSSNNGKCFASLDDIANYLNNL